MSEVNEVQLQVVEAQLQDVGQFVARINERTIQKLSISIGDVIEIVGKRKTSAIAQAVSSREQNRDIIRIDNFTRVNAGIATNETVTVRPAKVEIALNVTLAPVYMHLKVNEHLNNFVKSQILDRALVEGDTTPVIMLGHATPFLVYRTNPDGVVKMNAETQVTILNEPINCETTRK